MPLLRAYVSNMNNICRLSRRLLSTLNGGASSTQPGFLTMDMVKKLQKTPPPPSLLPEPLSGLCRSDKLLASSPVSDLMDVTNVKEAASFFVPLGGGGQQPNQQQQYAHAIALIDSLLPIRNNPFGQPQQQQPAQGGGLFGQPQQQPAAQGGFGGFGQTAPQSTGFGGASAFGSTQSTGNLFGQASTPATSAFGQPQASAPTNAFGQGSSAFGAPSTTSAFGSSGFGSTAPSTTSAFGAAKPFGAPSTPSTTSFGGFGAASTNQPVASAFGSQPSTSAFGAQPTTSAFGSAPQSAFGSQQPPAASGFGTSAFGSTQATTGFGAAPSTPSTGGLFGASSSAAPSTSGFGSAFGQPAAAAPQQAAPSTGGLFGTHQPSAFGTSAFGSQPAATPAAPSAFGQSQAQSTTSAFGQPQAQSTTSAFGQSQAQPATSAFGSQPAAATPFGSSQQTTGFGGFGAAPQATQQQQQQPAQPQTSFQPSFGGFGQQQPQSATPQTSSAPTFGQAPSTAAPSFGAAPSNQGTTPAPLFGQQPAAQPVTPSTPATASAAPGLGSLFKPGTSTTSASGFSFGSAAAPSTPAQISTPTVTPAAPVKPTETSQPASTGFSFATPSSQPSTTQPSATQPSAATSTAASDAKPTFSFAKTDATTGTTTGSGSGVTGGLSLTKPNETGTTSGTGETKTTVADSVKLPPSISFPSSLKGKNLEEIINSWNDDLESLVSSFEKQAVEVAQWDKKIVYNGQQIIALNDRVNKLEMLQKDVDQSLSYVIAQQTELEGLLDGIEREMPGLVKAATGGKQTVLDVERDRLYDTSEGIQKQVIDVASQLSTMIHEINSAAIESGVDVNVPDPVTVEMAQILNAHLDALQWIDGKVDELKKASTQVKSQSQKATHEMERLNH